jgi:hypothetical protein
MNFIAVGLIVLIVVASLEWAISFEHGMDGAPGLRALPPHDLSDEGATSLETPHYSKALTVIRPVADLAPFVETNSAPLRHRTKGRANAFAGASDLFAA